MIAGADDCAGSPSNKLKNSNATIEPFIEVASNARVHRAILIEEPFAIMRPYVTIVVGRRLELSPAVARSVKVR